MSDKQDGRPGLLQPGDVRSLTSFYPTTHKQVYIMHHRVICIRKRKAYVKIYDVTDASITTCYMSFVFERLFLYSVQYILYSVHCTVYSVH